MQFLLGPADWNGLIMVKLKCDLNCRGYIYFELAHPNAIHQALNYLKTYNKLCVYISIAEGLSSKEMIYFFRNGWTSRCCWKHSQKIILNKTEYGSVEDPSTFLRTE